MKDAVRNGLATALGLSPSAISGQARLSDFGDERVVAELASHVESQLGVELPLDPGILGCCSLSSLADLVTVQLRARCEPAQSVRSVADDAALLWIL